MSVLAGARAPAPKASVSASVSTTPRLKHVLAVGQQHHRRSRATGVVLSASQKGKLPSQLSFEELKRRATQLVTPMVYNLKIYEELYNDYESLLQQGYNSTIIRNTIVQSDPRIDNLTASYELKMKNTETYELTVYLYKDSIIYEETEEPTSYEYYGDFSLANDIADMWRTNEMEIPDIARKLGMTPPQAVNQTGVLSLDYPEFAKELFNRQRRAMEYLINDAVEAEDRVVTFKLMKEAVFAGDERAKQEVNRIQIAHRAKPNWKMDAARWFDRRMYKELSDNNLVHTLPRHRRKPHGPPGVFNENVMPSAFKYLEIVESIRKAFVMCLLNRGSQEGGRVRRADINAWDDGSFLEESAWHFVKDLLNVN